MFYRNSFSVTGYSCYKMLCSFEKGWRQCDKNYIPKMKQFQGSITKEKSLLTVSKTLSMFLHSFTFWVYFYLLNLFDPCGNPLTWRASLLFLLSYRWRMKAPSEIRHFSITNMCFFQWHFSPCLKVDIYM